ncbi:MAG: DUF1849 family protein [Pseudomonadota bacterium]
MKNKIFHILMFALLIMPAHSHAGIFGKNDVTYKQAKEKLQPHKALYNIKLVATRSGSPIINISGKMLYEWKPTCEGWITDHKFNLLYEYADSPGMEITSDFSTYETFDGENFNFIAQRKRNDQLYQEFRGSAETLSDGKIAEFSVPEDVIFDLDEKTYFPMTHTVKMIQKALNEDKFFNAVVFDGSDDEGPVIINTFIGSSAEANAEVRKSDAIDQKLVRNKAWNISMAVFPKDEVEEAAADYEMDVVFHENGVISDMLVDYDDFSVTQSLVALEKIEADSCS